MAKPISPPRPRVATSGEEALLGDAVVVTRLDRAIGWDDTVWLTWTPDAGVVLTR